MLNSGVRKSKKISFSYCSIKQDRICYNEKTIVPENEALRLKLLKKIYKLSAEGYYGAGKLINILKK